MKDLLTILIFERKTLVRGITLAFLAILPLTFVPAVLKYGFSLYTFLSQFNQSVLFALGLALSLVFVAVLKNYNELVDRKAYFDMPAFSNLDFHGMVMGSGSVIRDLETVLVGKVGDYHYQINLKDVIKKNPRLVITPLIELKDKKREVLLLKKEYGFRTDIHFGRTFYLSQFDLDDPESIQKLLEACTYLFKKLEFNKLKFDLPK